MILWRAEVEECNGNGGGVATVFIISQNPPTLPELNHSIQELSGGKYSIFRIRELENLYEIEGPAYCINYNG